jgi:hypothetical protein
MVGISNSKLQKDIKVVERPLMRVLNEFWYDRGEFDKGSVCIGGYYTKSVGLISFEPDLFLELLGNQVYLSMFDINNLQGEFGDISTVYLTLFENTVNMLLAIEITLNFQCSLVQGLLIAGDKN